MKTEEYIAIGTLISVISGSLALVIKQVEQSRCTKIKCCGLACDRTPPPNPDDIDKSSHIHIVQKPTSPLDNVYP